MSYAIELRDLRKNFGSTEIIRGAELQVPRGELLHAGMPEGALEGA